MSQTSSSDQFFSCRSEDERPTGSRQGLGDVKSKQNAGVKNKETVEATPSSLPPPHRGGEDMTSTNNEQTRIAQLPSSGPTNPADARATAPLIRASSRVSKVQTTRWRWLMLLIFTLNMAVSAGVLTTFVPSDRLLEYYYGECDSGWKRWAKHLALYDTVVKVLLLLPSAWMLVRYELKFTVVFASCSTALGTALRLIGASKCD